jgi:hypothetical protein
MYGPPIRLTTEVVLAKTLFSIKLWLDLFPEVGRLRFPVFHQRSWSRLTICASVDEFFDHTGSIY